VDAWGEAAKPQIRIPPRPYHPVRKAGLAWSLTRGADQPTTQGDRTEQYIPRPVYVRAARRHHDERLVCLSCLIRAGGHGPDARTTSRGIRFFGAGRTAPALRAAETRTTSPAQVGAWSCRFPPRKCDVGAYTTKARSGRLPVVRCACVASPPCRVEREREGNMCRAPLSCFTFG
jgi:hypothetical protein